MGFVIRCVPTFREINCCCCILSLKTATLIIAWLSLIGCVSQFIHGAVSLAQFDGKNVPIIPGEKAPRSTVAYQATLIGQMVGGLLCALINAALIYGTMKEKIKVILPIVKLQLVALALFILFGIFMTIRGFAVNVTAGVSILVGVIVAFAISLCLWMVVYNFYRQLDERQNPHVGIIHHPNLAESGKLTEPDNNV